MPKILLLQHAAHELLGSLDPTLKAEKFKIRYVNFKREPEKKPNLDNCHGMVILGGHMGVYEADLYSHLNTELYLIEDALRRGLPILGICLGAQLLAHALGSAVYKAPRMEIGWHEIEMTKEAGDDSLFSHFEAREKVFQLHGDTFEIPHGAVHLAKSKNCSSQAFRYGNNAYGLQFHLEADCAMIMRWLDNERNQKEIFSKDSSFSRERIIFDNEKFLERSTFLSQKTFKAFTDLFPRAKAKLVLKSR